MIRNVTFRPNFHRSKKFMIAPFAYTGIFCIFYRVGRIKRLRLHSSRVRNLVKAIFYLAQGVGQKGSEATGGRF